MGGAGNGPGIRAPRQSLTRHLFFKSIKQHLRIKAFYGTSANAVKPQIWVAMSVYPLLAILKKRLGLRVDLYRILQVASVTIFRKSRFYRLVNSLNPNSPTISPLTN
jgi:hypothetical protein